MANADQVTPYIGLPVYFKKIVWETGTYSVYVFKDTGRSICMANSFSDYASAKNWSNKNLPNIPIQI